MQDFVLLKKANAETSSTLPIIFNSCCCSYLTNYISLFIKIMNQALAKEEGALCSFSMHSFMYVWILKIHFVEKNCLLSHNNPCFQCNLAITNFLVSHTCRIRFHDVIVQSTVHVHMYSY